MKNILIIGALILGFVIGWSVQSLRHSAQTAQTKNLANLYSGENAIQAGWDMRTLTLLNDNDIPMAKKVLIENLDYHVTTLSKLSRESELSGFEIRELKGVIGPL
jgi:hypothetical protein